MMVGMEGVFPARSRRRLALSVRAIPESLAEVRRSLGALEIPPGLLEDARLLTSELVGNSIRHSGMREDEYVDITAEGSGARLRVAVHDRPRPPPPRSIAGSIRPLPGAASGWGLFIVDRLASRWGTDEAGYWFELEGFQSLLSSVTYVAALSLWALVSGHWSAWQAARVEVNQEAEAKERDDADVPGEIVERIVKETDVGAEPGSSPHEGGDR